ncbi:MAG: CvpA family protein [Candidatus Uhrbacteria bacterium]|nr:CvpA family protein [Candidatus Uhrbacteria bacterium]
MFQTIDIIILVILCTFFVMGFTRGLIKQVGSLAGYFVALWAASHYYMPVADYIKKGLSGWQPLLAGPLSIVVGFLGAYIIAAFLWHILIKLVDGVFRLFSIVPFLNMTNRLGGAAIGLIEGVLLLSALAFVVLNFPLSQEFTDKVRKSTFVPVLEQVSGLIKPLLPSVVQSGQGLLNSIPGLPGQIPSLPTIDVNKVDPAAIRQYMKQLNISEEDLPPEVQALLNQKPEKKNGTKK